MVREGRSFSGREPHCAFLNLGNGQFCDVSAIGGFDLDDDGRALALVDWDQDGDLDAWISNRNGPQVRFLRNQFAASGNHFVALRLQGTKSNRDAIGATVRIYTKQASRPLSRTVRAGTGFLTQSSKWLHFGLGSDDSIDRLEIDWPGGERQHVSIPQVDARYRIVQGDALPKLWPAAESLPEEPKVAPEELAAKPSTSLDRAFCFSMVHLPVQSYRDLGNREQPVSIPGGRMVLVNLWADWCQPCVRELGEFARDAARLRQQGLDVVALSVDATLEHPQSSAAAESQLLKQLEFPFRAGRADRAMVEKLQLLHDTLFELRRPLPIPTSFLVDRQGRVTVIYRGPVSVEQLLADKARLAAKTTDQWRMATLEFDGRWFMPPRRRHLFEYVQTLVDRGYMDDGVRYVRWNQKMITSHPNWPELARRLEPGTAAETSSP